MSTYHCLAIRIRLFLFSSFIAATPSACGDDSDISAATDTDEIGADETGMADTDGAEFRAVQTFYNIYNPNGKSYLVRLTATIPSGTGKILGGTIWDNSPYFNASLLTCNSKQCIQYKSLPCKDYGTMHVDVQYTGTVAPTLKYWFYDC